MLLGEIAQTFWRSVFSLAVMFVLTKLMGYKQISQLSFFDYIIGISIGSISADLATGQEGELYQTLIPLMVYGSCSVLFSVMTLKSINIRRAVSGTSVILIDNGRMIEENLKKVKYDINDFLSDCRQAGYFNVNDIAYAVMEHNGKISFLPYPDKRPCTPSDLKVSVSPEGLTANLIIDGKIMYKHLEIMGKNEAWLKKQLNAQKIISPKQVLLATLDTQGEFNVFKKDTDSTTLNVLD
ncbi:MAG: DUF421 domain-containing protein [Oscillospiraceae bacterium]|nr:DUF421 domain-containing protein [Oscillospiraceae bacterium]